MSASPAPADIGVEASACFHCGLPLPDGPSPAVLFDGIERPMCCPGCAAVCGSILDAGLADFYRFRTSPSGRAADVTPDSLIEAGVYDLPAVQKNFVTDTADGHREASLALSGITCAACTWLVERQLRALPGVSSADVNFATHRVRVTYDPAIIDVSALLGAVHAVGYRAYPYDPATSERELDSERRQRLRELGLAGVLSVQIMMLALAGYLGGDSMESGIGQLLDWASMLLAVPVVTVCARPFLRAALRGLRTKNLGMDVPVSLAILAAFAGSVWATITAEGAVYYDSVAMFTFLLLLARFGEFSARRQAAVGLFDSLQSLPAFARRQDTGGGEEMVAVASLLAGDRVVVRAGETVPADGVVVRGCSSVDEALLTGESRPRRRQVGDALIGGSTNVESPLEMEVRAVGEASVLCGLLALAERARDGRPGMARSADRVASVFVVAVLVLSTVVAVWWWQFEPQRVLPVVITLLVATCPCALSLATPTALVAGAGALTRLGLIATRADVIEQLAALDHVVFDKTGTLTRGRPRLVAVQSLGGADREQCLAVAAALESASEHPLAAAVRGAAEVEGVLRQRVDEVVNEPGAGLRGVWNGEQVLLGSPAWVADACGGAANPSSGSVGEGRASVAWLAAGGRVVAVLRFEDEPREDAAELISALRDARIGVTLASGDCESAVENVAARLGISDWHAAMRPQDKLALVQGLQAKGRRVLVLGDGINDVPVLAGADVAVAMPDGAQIARVRADAVLVVDRLVALSVALQVAGRTLRIVRQNLAWALLYNLLALPLAASGLMAPWMAALGMSSSSLVVVGNALRARVLPVSRSR